MLYQDLYIILLSSFLHSALTVPPLFLFYKVLNYKLNLYPLRKSGNFLGGPVVNQSANAGHMCFIPSREDSTCHRVLKPISHNYLAHSLETKAASTDPMHLEPVVHSKRSQSNEKPTH